MERTSRILRQGSNASDAFPSFTASCVLGYLGVPRDPALLALGFIAQALVCASLGTLIAVFSKALEDFAVIMNFVIFPVFFLSGALYPIEHLPGVLKAVALANPSATASIS